MKSFLLVAVLSASVFLYAEEASSEQQEVKISYALLNNDYYIQSVKERNMARLTLEGGDYDASARHSAEAERLAKLSDEYIARKLLERRLSAAMSEASSRLTWARSNEAETYFPAHLKTAEEHYAAAVAFRNENSTASALENALAVIEDLAAVAAPPPRTKAGKVVEPPNVPKSPNQYTVRPWDAFGDCFWNIAERFYGSARFWPELYAINKSKIPDPNNPNLIEVGTVIDIPAVKGEQRAGMYDTGRPYTVPSPSGGR